MKRTYYILLAIVGAVFTVCAKPIGTDPGFINASSHGAIARIKVTLVSEAQTPITNANVNVRFGMLVESDSRTISGRTDEHGIAVVEGLTCGNYLTITATHPGHYPSTSKLCLVEMGREACVHNGIWESPTCNVRLILRRTINPIRLVSHGGVFTLPQTNTWCSFDMFVGDWVQPYGKGTVADVEMRFNWVGSRPKDWQQQNLELRFVQMPNGGSLFPIIAESAFPFTYTASTNRICQSAFTKCLTSHSDKRSLLDGIHDFTFRIRATTNAVGEVVSCHYGRLRRFDFGVTKKQTASILIRYDLNPATLDPNLETSVNIDSHGN